jgi:hypothetical protein
MLGVLVMLMQWARDPKTWRWIAPDDEVAQAEPEIDVPPPIEEKSPIDDVRIAAGPTDLDPAERESAREEFQAVADKAPLAPEEMPAYWRLMAWTLHQSTAEMRKRAEQDVTYQDLWNQPDKWRGKLIELPLHLQRTITVNDPVENELGLKTLYEAWGWNSNSQPYTYWLILPELPPGMPRGENVLEEATFVGYFFKLIPYEDRQGKQRATPLVIGRLVWHPAPDNPLARRDEWTWTWYVAAALLALFALRWGLALWGRIARGPSDAPAAAGQDAAVESWLAGEDSQQSDQIVPDAGPFDPYADQPESK